MESYVQDMEELPVKTNQDRDRGRDRERDRERDRDFVDFDCQERIALLSYDLNILIIVKFFSVLILLGIDTHK